MRNVALFACACALLAGCSFLKKKTDDADAAAEAGAVAEAAEASAPEVDAAPAPAAVTAKNAAEVARFAAETAIGDDDLKLATASPARTTPKGGNVVATLNAGADVTKLAEYQGCILVTFADPKDAASTLMGWIAKEAFVAVAKKDGGVTDAGTLDAAVAKDAAAPVVDAGAPKCAAGKVAVVLSTSPVCRTRCTKDADCKDKKAGACATAQTATGTVAKVCVADQ